MAMPPAEASGYPRELERAVSLRDGTVVRLRPIRPEDAPRLVEMYDRLSRHSAYQRFFTVMRRLPPDWAQMLATVDYRRRLAIVAEHAGPANAQPTGFAGAERAGLASAERAGFASPERAGFASAELIAVARYEPAGTPDTAEVAFVVQDGWQNRGLGTILLDALLAAAEARGIRRFTAFVLADNMRMLDMLARFTDVQERRVASGVVELTFTRRRTQAAATGTVSAGAR
jgi:RimJ/RimL family protein N-acetyltransferase